MVTIHLEGCWKARCFAYKQHSERSPAFLVDPGDIRMGKRVFVRHPYKTPPYEFHKGALFHTIVCRSPDIKHWHLLLPRAGCRAVNGLVPHALFMVVFGFSVYITVISDKGFPRQQRGDPLLLLRPVNILKLTVAPQDRPVRGELVDLPGIAVACHYHAF